MARRDPRSSLLPHPERANDQFNLLATTDNIDVIVASDLSEAQRQRFTSSLSLRGMNAAYTIEAVTTVFVELFCAPKSSMENPSLQHEQNLHRGRLCCGQWAKDEVTGEQGYIDDKRSCFWTWDDTESAWQSRLFKSRQVKKKEKERKGRFKRTRRAFFGDEQVQDPEWWSKEDFA